MPKGTQSKKRADPMFSWAMEQRKIWRNAIRLMKEGKMGTSGVRRGRIVDTTAETLSDYSKLVTELEKFLTKHGACDT